ncbi:MAG: YqjF family protein [Actinomycetota bacterium]
MYQTWSWLAFLHWSYPPEVVQRLLPSGLRVHDLDGRAWVGLTPFVLEDLRTPVAPVPPWFSRFPETNVRTYVVGPDGREGLWFFSLDAARLEPVLVARSTYSLPYMWSAMTVERDGPTVRYRSRRRWPGPTPAASEITVDVGDPLAPAELGELDHYLTARWQLYTTLGPVLARSTVEHEPWPLHRAVVRQLDSNLVTAAGLPAPAGEPVVHWSPGVRTRIGGLWPLGRA